MSRSIYNKKSLTLYFAMFLLFAIVNAISLIIFFSVQTKFAIIEAMTVNISFAFIGIGVWYVVKYSYLDKNRYLHIIKYIASAIVLISIWILSLFLIESLIKNLFFSLSNLNFSYSINLFIGIFYFLILVLIYRLILLFNQYLDNKKEQENLKLLLQESRLNALKAYINPHFLFNSLNSVNSLIKTNPDKAREILINMSDYFRSCLKTKDYNSILLRDELANALNYFNIEMNRFSSRIEFNEEIDDNCLNYSIPPMILQPLFENIIKHAVNQTEKLIVINLKIFRREDNFVEIILENSLDASSLENRRGEKAGLDITSKRLQMQFDRKDLLHFTKTKENFKLVILLPKTDEKE